MTRTLMAVTAIALGLSSFGLGCDDDDREDAFEERVEERADYDGERTVGDEMTEDEAAGQGLATADQPLRIGEQPRNCAPGAGAEADEATGAVGAATSIPAEGSFGEVVARVRRALEEEQLEVVHTQGLVARAPEGQPAAKPGDRGPARGELILFTRTTDLEEALAVNPARALEAAKQLLVYESDGDVYIAFRAAEPGTQEYQPGYHGMGASKPGGMPTSSQVVDIEAVAETAARGEEQPTGQGRAASGDATMDGIAPPTDEELNQMEMEDEPAEGEENPYRHETNVDPEQGLR